MNLRNVPVDAGPEESFFLWGPRQVGKSYFLRQRFSGAIFRDLLHTETYRRYLHHPGLLRQELLGSPSGTLVVIDEIRKVPALLDEEVRRKALSGTWPSKIAVQKSLFQATKQEPMDTFQFSDLDFRPNPSAIIGAIAGPSLGVMVASKMGVASPAGLLAAGLVGAVAGYATFSNIGDH